MKVAIINQPLRAAVRTAYPYARITRRIKVRRQNSEENWAYARIKDPNGSHMAVF